MRLKNCKGCKNKEICNGSGRWEVDSPNGGSKRKRTYVTGSCEDVSSIEVRSAFPEKRVYVKGPL